MLEKIFEKINMRDLIPIIIASICIVGFWRGIWGLMDIFLFPDNELKSYISSAIIGFVMLLGISFYRSKRVV
jgi:hypothetical protein